MGEISARDEVPSSGLTGATLFQERRLDRQ